MHMNFQTAKKPSDVNLEGIAIEFDVRDGCLVAVDLTDGKGGHFRIAKTDYSSIGAFVPAKPKLVEKWALRGTFFGLKVDELFADEWSAKQRADELGYADGSKGVCTVEKVEVPE
jgi:hypothetical protein